MPFKAFIAQPEKRYAERYLCCCHIQEAGLSESLIFINLIL
jgi:hypothetical protein